MKKILGLIAIIGILGVSLWMDAPPKAWGDVASLTIKKPLQGDLIDYFSNGTQYSVNWQQFTQYLVQSVNWQAVGALNSQSQPVNWTLPNAYIGG